MIDKCQPFARRQPSHHQVRPPLIETILYLKYDEQGFRFSTCDSPAEFLSLNPVAVAEPVNFSLPTVKLTLDPLTLAWTNSGLGSSAPP
jgi:hypothetical protein